MKQNISENFACICLVQLCWILSQNGDLISFGRRGVSNTYSQYILKCKNEELCTQITKDIDRQ